MYGKPRKSLEKQRFAEKCSHTIFWPAVFPSWWVVRKIFVKWILLQFWEFEIFFRNLRGEAHFALRFPAKPRLRKFSAAPAFGGCGKLRTKRGFFLLIDVAEEEERRRLRRRRRRIRRRRWSWIRWKKMKKCCCVVVFVGTCVVTCCCCVVVVVVVLVVVLVFGFVVVVVVFCGCSLLNNTQRKIYKMVFQSLPFSFPFLSLTFFLSVFPLFSFLSFSSFLSSSFLFPFLLLVLVLCCCSCCLNYKCFIYCCCSCYNSFLMSWFLLFCSFGGFFVCCCCALCCYVVKLAKAKKTPTQEKKTTPQKSGRTSVHFEHAQLCLHVQ